MLAVCATAGGAAGAQGAQPDFSAYEALANAAHQAHEALEAGRPQPSPDLYAEAEARDRAVLDWLADFLATRDFRQLDDQAQALVLRDRDRARYNLAGVLLGQGRCQDATDLLQTTADELADSQLGDLVRSLQDESVCARASVAGCTGDLSSLTIDGDPRPVGPADVALARGRHIVEVEATDGTTASFVEEAQPGQELALCPDVALALAEATRAGERRSPVWYEWTLWGAGLGGVGAGIGYLVWSSNRQEQLADMERRGMVIVDPERESQVVNDLRLVGTVLMSVGLVAGTAGTLSYILDQPGPRDRASAVAHSTLRLRLDGLGLMLEGRF